MTCNFRIGQKVVCINPEHTNSLNIPELVKGAIYTISGKEIYHDGTSCVHLEEVERLTAPLRGPCPFRADRFRPLQENKDSLAALRAILLDPSRKVSGPEGPVRKRAREPQRAQGH